MQGNLSVSGKIIIMAGLAVAFGTTSYVGGNYYLESQTQARTKAALNELETNRPVVEQVELAKVIVAKSEIRFGEEITKSNVNIVDWPQEAFPEGAFTAISELTKDGSRRALATIFPGEPIITAKLTGKNGRAGLAGIIADGMRAVTIPVNTVNGVGGFIQPGDRVDVLLTKDDGDQGTQSEILMNNVKILTVDQNVGGRLEAAQIADSVTVETNTLGARKIAQGLNSGTLSLILRGAGDEFVNVETTENENSDFLGLTEKPKTKSIRVVNRGQVTEYEVKIEGSSNNQ